MDITVQLPMRLATIRRLADTRRINPVTLTCCMLYYLNDSMVIHDYNHRATTSLVSVTAREILRIFNWEMFPISDVYECDRVSINGITLVLHNVRTF